MIKHIAGIAEIVEDIHAAARLYEGLGLDVTGDLDAGYASIGVAGILHFGLWDRRRAAQSVFGSEARVDDIPLGFTIGFEVDDLPADASRLAEVDIEMVQEPQTEPWGQDTARFLLPSGALGELSVTPWARHITQDIVAETK